MRTARSVLLMLVVLVVAALLGGCTGYRPGWWHWFDPTRPFHAPKESTIKPILPGISPADQTRELLPNAELPRAEDLEFGEEDYVIGPTDILNIMVMDLFQEGMEALLQRQVGHAGYIDLPFLPQRIKASGLTQLELRDAIKQAYDPEVLRNPQVTVMVAVPRQNTFSILGAVSRPGTYNILRKDFPLLEALALAGDVTQMNIETLYVIRPKKRQPRPSARPGAPGAPTGRLPTLPPLPEIPSSPLETRPAPGATRPATDVQRQLRELERFIPGVTGEGTTRPSTIPSPSAERINLSAAGIGPGASRPATGPTTVPEDLRAPRVKSEWMYVDGQWVRAEEPRTRPVGPGPAESRPAPTETDPFGWMQYDMSHLARIVAIDLANLKAGDPRLNIIIRPNDVIHVPFLEVGEFYVMGEVARPGAYALTGRKVTVKQALAAAGPVTALGWPNNSILIRRVGRNREQVRQLKAADIMAGIENDIFLKRNDVIAIGSYWAATPLAVWRNAFRMTYGFGFIYDRNYSTENFEVPIFFPNKWPRGR